MTLGRLIELYQAELAGKQVMRKTISNSYYNSTEVIEEVTIVNVELSELILDESSNTEYEFFIKDEEDEYGNKII